MSYKTVYLLFLIQQQYATPKYYSLSRFQHQQQQQQHNIFRDVSGHCHVNIVCNLLSHIHTQRVVLCAAINHQCIFYMNVIIILFFFNTKTILYSIKT